MIGAYQRESITWRQITRDQWNAPTEADTTIDARVVWKTRLIRNMAGDFVQSAGYVLVSSKPSHDDQFVIDSVIHGILAIDERKAFTVVSHYRVHLG